MKLAIGGGGISATRVGLFFVCFTVSVKRRRSSRIGRRWRVLGDASLWPDRCDNVRRARQTVEHDSRLRVARDARHRRLRNVQAAVRRERANRQGKRASERRS